MNTCRVQLLDGSEVDIDIDKKASGQELFDLVCKKLSLNEVDYFGCTYKENKNTKVWLNNNKKIFKQISNTPWVFSFEVKFYPPDPTCLNEEITRYQLFLQLRTDILSGKLPCSFMTYALLGSYAAQSQLGDYCPSDHGTGHAYLKDIGFSPSQTDELLDKITELHKTNQGMQPAEAELCFLDNAYKLSLYGVHMFQAKDSNDSEVLLGICAAGLLVYKERLRLHRFTWPKILKISYKRNVFTIKIRPGEFEQMETTMEYKLANYQTAKRLWRLAVEHHSFFRLRETDPPPHGLFSRFGPKYRYTGRTFYQAQQMGDKNQRATVTRLVGRKFAGSRSMETVLTTYSTERAEAYQYDGSRSNTLDIRGRRSTNDLDNDEQAGYGNDGYGTGQKYGGGSGGDANVVGVGGVSSGVGGVSPNYNEGRSQSSSRKINDNLSCSATSDEATFPLEPYPQQHSQQQQQQSYYSYMHQQQQQQQQQQQNTGYNNQPLAANQYDMLYEQRIRAGNDDGWTAYNGGTSSLMTSSSSKTYTASDGTIITEHRIERNGVIETRIEKRHPDGGYSNQVDYDKALSDAIQAVTNMNTDLAVEKIEIQTKDSHSTFI